MVLLVTYDLNKPGKDYSELYKAIRAISNDCIHPLESIWILDTSYSAKSASDYLRNHIDSNDNLFVVRLTRDSAGWMAKDAWTWLGNRISF